MTTVDLLIVSNTVIGICFSIVPLSAIWLYMHRHKDWPKPWVLLLVGISMGASGFSRIVHAITYYYWPRITLESMAISDLVTAMLAVAGALLLPWAIYEIKKAPTPSEYQKMAAKATETMIAQAHAEWATKEKEKAERRVTAMKAMLSDYSMLDPELRNQMLKITEEL